MAKIRFFASIKERLNKDSIEISIPEPTPLKDLLVRLSEEHDIDKSIILNGSLMYAVNETMQQLDFLVSDNDEVAALPPLSGGV